MASVNKVFLLGNLTRDPELKELNDQRKVARFGLAVNKKYQKDGQWKTEAMFIDVVAWNKHGENCSKYLKKGSLIHLEGELKFKTWESDGEKKNRHEVEVINIQYLNGKKD